MDKNVKLIDCGNHKMENLKFDCEHVDGKVLPRWSISCSNCGLKEYSSFISVEYVPIPTVVFSEKSFHLKKP